MGLKLKFNTIIVLAIALLFNRFFMFTKHDPALSAIMPFGEDPYDSTGSVAMIVGDLLAMLSLVRAFRPRRAGYITPLSKLFLARTHMAIAIAPLVALAGDTVAMVRHPFVWSGKPATGELVALMAGMAAVSIAGLLLVRSSMQGINLPEPQNRWKGALVITMLCVLALAFYPEGVIQSIPLHFLTIVAGFVLFLAPQSALTVALLPNDTRESRAGDRAGTGRFNRWIQWATIAALGIAIGALILMTEIFAEGNTGLPFRKLLLLSAIFIGSGTSALLIAFAFLREPLGLFRNNFAA
jgi:hypothetical protein